MPYAYPKIAFRWGAFRGVYLLTHEMQDGRLPLQQTLSSSVGKDTQRRFKRLTVVRGSSNTGTENVRRLRPNESAGAFRLLVDAAALWQWRDRVEHAPWSAQTCSVDSGGPVREARDVGVPEEEI